MLKGDHIEVRAMRADYQRGFSVVVAVENEIDGSVSIAKPLVFEKHDMAYLPTPTFDAAAGTQFLQAAMNCAWEMGLRPTNWHDERPGEIRAMGAHLEDMRKLVFGTRNPSGIAEMMQELKGVARRD